MRALITGSLSSLVNYILIYLIGMLISRLLGAGNYGQIAYIIAIATIVSYLFSLGLPKMALQLIPKYIYRKQDQKLKGFISGSLFFIITVSFAISIIAILIHMYVMPLLHDLTFADYALMLTLATTIALTRFLAYCLEGGGQFVLGSVLYKVVAPVLWLIFILIMYFVSFIKFAVDPILTAYSYAWAMSAFLSLIFVLYYFSNRIWKTKSRYNWEKWLKFGSAYATNSFSLIVTNQIGLIVLGATQKNAITIGVYAAILNIVSFMYLMLTASNGYFLPLIASARAQSSVAKVNEILTMRFKYLGLIAVGFLIMVFLLGEVLLGLYGSIFAKYNMPLMILSLIYTAETLLGISVNIIVIYGHQTRSAISQVLAATTAVILTFWLTPKLGIYGPILAYVFTKIVAAIGNTAWLYYHYKIKVISHPTRKDFHRA